MGSTVTGHFDVGAIVEETDVGLLDVGEVDRAATGEMVGLLVVGCMVPGL